MDLGQFIENRKPDNFVTRNQIGRFQISQSFIEHCPDKALLLFSKVIVCRMEHYYDMKTFSYYAYSPLFTSIESGLFAPEYQINMTETEDGEIKITATKTK